MFFYFIFFLRKGGENNKINSNERNEMKRNKGRVKEEEEDEDLFSCASLTKWLLNWKLNSTFKALRKRQTCILKIVLHINLKNELNYW